MNELNRVRQLFTQFRNTPITVIFGNMGRHPILLEYYTKSCLSADETWVVCHHFPSTETVHFLFVVEPYFGYTVLKPSKVKHLVVWSSHLNLTLLQGTKMDVFYLSQFENNSKPLCNMDYKEWIPPLLHGESGLTWDGPVQMDVSQCKTLNETFLRMLTGYEMIRGRLFTIKMDDYQKKMLKHQLLLTKERSQLFFSRCWFDTLCETLYIYIL